MSINQWRTPLAPGHSSTSSCQRPKDPFTHNSTEACICIALHAPLYNPTFPIFIYTSLFITCLLPSPPSFITCRLQTTSYRENCPRLRAVLGSFPVILNRLKNTQRYQSSTVREFDYADFFSTLPNLCYSRHSLLATPDLKRQTDLAGVTSISQKLQGPRGTWHQHAQDESL